MSLFGGFIGVFPEVVADLSLTSADFSLRNPRVLYLFGNSLSVVQNLILFLYPIKGKFTSKAC